MKSQVRTVLLLGGLSALTIGVGAAIAPGWLPVFVVFALLVNLGAWFFSDRLVLRLHGAQEVDPRDAPGLTLLVAEVARAAGVPTPRIYVTPERQPNAFATGRNPANGAVVFTEGVLRTMGDRELRGVVAHELAHIRNRDVLVASLAAAAASVITWLAHVLSFSWLFGGSADGGAGEDGGEGSAASPLGGLLVALVAPLAATLVQLGISRTREFLADETAARITGDPEGLARALLLLDRSAAELPAEGQPAAASLYIVNPLAGGGVARWFSTHPPIAERVRRLRALAGAPRAERAPGLRAGWGLA